jgi:hypothetical protein
MTAEVKVKPVPVQSEHEEYQWFSNHFAHGKLPHTEFLS